MGKYNLAQLQAALISLYKSLDKFPKWADRDEEQQTSYTEVFDAYQMVFDEVANRMGEAFDAWMDINLA